MGFWIPKIERNMQRDKYINQQLSAKGYTVMRFRKHEVKESLSACANKVSFYIEAAKAAAMPQFDYLTIICFGSVTKICFLPLKSDTIPVTQI